MPIATTLNPRLKRQQARQINGHREALLPSEQAVRFGLDAFIAAGTKLRRHFEEYERDKDNLHRFAEINEDLEVKVFSVRLWLTMLINLVHLLVTAFLTSWLLYGILDVELINSVSQGVAEFFSPKWGGAICVLLALSLLASAARLKDLAISTGKLIWSIAAFVTVCVVPAYTMILCVLQVYGPTDFWATYMFWAAVANMLFGVLFVVGGADHWTSMSTAVALGRRAWLRMLLRWSHRTTEAQQDATRKTLSALRVVAGTMRHHIEDMRALGGTPRITMLGRLEAAFIDDEIYGEPVLLIVGTVTGNANMNNPAEFLPLLERLGNWKEWMDEEEAAERAPAAEEPTPTAAGAEEPPTPPDADSAFEDDTTHGPRVDNTATGRVHPEDRTI